LVALLIAGTLTANVGFQQVKAVTIQAAGSIVNFAIVANLEGWNATVAGCTSGTPNCNPTIIEFRGVPFTVQVRWGNCCAHDFAIYTKDFPASGVDPLSTCSTTSTNGCLAKSATISAGTTTLSFNATVPKDDFTGLGGYEYYCQFHPLSMHGKFTVYKTPDLVKAGVVNIVDVATVAFSFGATPTSTNWNAAADLDNNGIVNILDVATVAFYFGKTI
jgi:plastocyanin